MPGKRPAAAAITALTVAGGTCQWLWALLGWVFRPTFRRTSGHRHLIMPPYLAASRATQPALLPGRTEGWQQARTNSSRASPSTWFSSSSRTLDVVQRVRQEWLTQGGGFDEARLAGHLFDGTANALEQLLYGTGDVALHTARCAAAAPPSDAGGDDHHRHPTGRQQFASSCGAYKVPVLGCAALSPGQFFIDFMMPHRPVVLREMTAGWRMSSEWLTTASPNGEGCSATGTHPNISGGGDQQQQQQQQPVHVPCFAAIAQDVGPEAQVPVRGVWATGRGGGRISATRTVSLGSYAVWWDESSATRGGGSSINTRSSTRGSGDGADGAEGSGGSGGRSAEPQTAPPPPAHMLQGEGLYLKDWHYPLEHDDERRRRGLHMYHLRVIVITIRTLD
eukprot:SAG25_NODE_1375_length_3172_cov_1.819069_3_plen_393_part_00